MVRFEIRCLVTIIFFCACHAAAASPFDVLPVKCGKEIKELLVKENIDYKTLSGLVLKNDNEVGLTRKNSRWQIKAFAEAKDRDSSLEKCLSKAAKLKLKSKRENDTAGCYAELNNDSVARLSDNPIKNSSRDIVNFSGARALYEIGMGRDFSEYAFDPAAAPGQKKDMRKKSVKSFFLFKKDEKQMILNLTCDLAGQRGFTEEPFKITNPRECAELSDNTPKVNYARVDYDGNGNPNSVRILNSNITMDYAFNQSCEVAVSVSTKNDIKSLVKIDPQLCKAIIADEKGVLGKSLFLENEKCAELAKSTNKSDQPKTLAPGLR